MSSRGKRSWPLRSVHDRIDQLQIELADLRSKLDTNNQLLERIESKIDLQTREARLLGRAMTMPPARQWPEPASEQALPGVLVFDRSRPCRELDFQQPYFAYWTARMGHHLGFHRKLWEFVFICQVLHERGALAHGARGLGFGVGGEPLPALFASMGCEILATDLSPEEAVAKGWTATRQHAHDRDIMRRPTICPDDLFDRRVRFCECDMNAVPEAFSGFDFCWSACAFEHLGSIDRGLEFVERSVQCLRPGGLAVHTTEFNLTSNDETVDHTSTVLFRRRDLETLAERLRCEGHEMVQLDFNPGDGLLDAYVDLPPYLDEPHLKVALEGFVTTSFGIIVRKGG